MAGPEAPPTRHHFLVIAAASRGARYFVKNALRLGHDVTAVCRAEDDAAALSRMQALLSETSLTEGGAPAVRVPGTLQASCRNILEPATFQSLLTEQPDIDRVCCFVGVTSFRKMMSRETRLYTKTVSALVEGMRQSRWVEFYYHGSSGLEGPPGASKIELPANFSPRWLLNLGLKIPAALDCFESESLLADAAESGLRFVVFRPAWLTTSPARRVVGSSLDTTSLDEGSFPLRGAKTTISREDVAEELFRVATLPDEERAQWFGHGVYLADRK